MGIKWQCEFPGVSGRLQGTLLLLPVRQEPPADRSQRQRLRSSVQENWGRGEDGAYWLHSKIRVDDIEKISNKWWDSDLASARGLAGPPFDNNHLDNDNNDADDDDNGASDKVDDDDRNDLYGVDEWDNDGRLD